MEETIKITVYPGNDLVAIVDKEKQTNPRPQVKIMSDAVMILHSVADSAHKFAIEVSNTFSFKMSPIDIDANKQQLSASLRITSIEIGTIKKWLKKDCIAQRKNMGLFFFYYDAKLSRRVYVAEGGYLSPYFDGAEIMYCDLTHERYFPQDPAEMVPDAVMRDYRIVVSDPVDIIPVFQLPTLAPEPQPEQVSVSRMVDIIRTLVIYLSTADGIQVIPEGCSMYEIEPALGVVTPLEERQALRLFVASVCRDAVTLKKVCEDYRAFIEACARADKTFCSRMVAANPAYAHARDAHKLAGFCVTTIHVMAETYSKAWTDLPVAIRCVLSLYCQN